MWLSAGLSRHMSIHTKVTTAKDVVVNPASNQQEHIRGVPTERSFLAIAIDAAIETH